MQIVFKFQNGDEVSVPDFDKLPMILGDQDLVSTLKMLKTNDLPIVIKGEDGKSYSSSGKHLTSIEVMLD